ncbi:MAG: hypothetical protein ACRD3S_07095 [Terracidiphilus sp.]
MAAATILHVGEDACYRIPLLERAGVLAVRTECSVRAIENVFAAATTFSGIAFHNELSPTVCTVAVTARKLSTAPLILFQNTLTDCDEELFDLVVPVQTPPEIWLESLRETIRAARELKDASQQLRQETAEVRAASRRLRGKAVQNCVAPVDYDTLWRNKRG